jgi:hypothetical protein
MVPWAGPVVLNVAAAVVVQAVQVVLALWAGMGFVQAADRALAADTSLVLARVAVLVVQVVDAGKGFVQAADRALVEAAGMGLVLVVLDTGTNVVGIAGMDLLAEDNMGRLAEDNKGWPEANSRGNEGVGDIRLEAGSTGLVEGADGGAELPQPLVWFAISPDVSVLLSGTSVTLDLIWRSRKTLTSKKMRARGRPGHTLW